MTHLAKITLYRTFKDARSAVLGLRDVPEASLRELFASMFPDTIKPQGKLIASSKSAAELAALIVAYYHAFHFGYGSAQGDVTQGRNLHTEIQ